MGTLHLRDNSWYVSECDESKREELRYLDTYNRKPYYLKQGYYEALQVFSNSTIGELMEAEGSEVFVWPNSFDDGNEALKEQRVFSVSSLYGKKAYSVTTSNVVGFIGKGSDKGGTNIHIHSRFSSFDEKGKGDDFFLYYMLEKVMSINTFSYTSSSRFRDPQIFDFLLLFFPRLLKDAMSMGMYKKYVYHDYNDANIRGVIDVGRHLRLNYPANGKIAYRTREFCYDNSVTQLIRHTIEFIRRRPFGMAVLHNDPDTEGYVQQIIQSTPSYESRQRQSIINENLRPINHPFFTKYTALQKLCLRILRYERLSYGEGADKIRGILIDVAWLWEEYLAKVLSEKGSSRMKHYTRKGSKFSLFINGDKHFQKIIPDYLDLEKKLVADAKYIPLQKDELSAEKAASVYYKTIMYMFRFNANNGFLFHPVSRIKEEGINEITAIGDEEITISDYTVEDRPECHLFKVGLVIDDVGGKVSVRNTKGSKNKMWRSYKEMMEERETRFVEAIYKSFKKDGDSR